MPAPFLGLARYKEDIDEEFSSFSSLLWHVLDMSETLFAQGRVLESEERVR